MEFVIDALRFVLWLYILVIFARIVLSYVMVLSRDWKPKGAVLVLTETVFTVTDPPIKALRKVVPKIQLGNVQLDLSVMILVFACWFVDALLQAI